MAVSERLWTRNPELLRQIWGTAMAGHELPPGLEKEGLFYVLAAASGIATPDGMWKYYTENPAPEGQNGIDWMIDRFKKVNLLTQWMWARAEVINPKLYELLTLPVQRKREPGIYDKGNVPKSYHKFIPPVSTPTGWAAPRMFLLLKPPLNTVVDKCLVASSAPQMLLAVLAENIYAMGIDSKSIIELVLKKHILDEQNNPEMYFDVIDQLQIHAPRMWQNLMPQIDIGMNLLQKPGWVHILNMYYAKIKR
jgi:hypothetical protein